MKSSGRLPFFVQVPFHASLNDWFNSIKSSELYSIHGFRFDAEIFPLLIEARPCLILTSILDENSKSACLEFLHEFKKYRRRQGYPSRDPSLRIVVIAKNRQAASSNWPDLGVYELMIAPVPTNVLMYKLSRHHQKALTAETPKASVQPIEEIPLKEILPSGTLHASAEWRTYGMISEKSAAELIKRNERVFQKLEIEVKIGDLDPEEGEWVAAEESISVERKWDWKPKSDVAHHDSKPMTSTKARFWGEKPVFQATQKTWQLSGERPRLEKQTESKDSMVPILTTEPNAQLNPVVQSRPSLEIQSAKQKIFLEPIEAESDEERTLQKHAQEKLKPSSEPMQKTSLKSENRMAASPFSRPQPDLIEPRAKTRSLIEEKSEVDQRLSDPLKDEVSLLEKLKQNSQAENAFEPKVQSPKQETRSEKSAGSKLNEGSVEVSEKKESAFSEVGPIRADAAAVPPSLSPLRVLGPASQDQSMKAMSSTPDRRGVQSQKGSSSATLGSVLPSIADSSRDPTPFSSEMGSASLASISNSDASMRDIAQKGVSVLLPEDEVNQTSKGSSAIDLNSKGIQETTSEPEKNISISQSSDESSSSVAIHSDEEESFWSILYDDEESGSSKEKKKKKSSIELDGWSLKRIQKNTLQPIRFTRDRHSRHALTRISKKSLLERILHFIRQFFGLKAK